MKNNFGHDVVTSFTLWFEHYMIKHGEGYKNLTGTYYHVEDERLPDGIFRYSTPYKQLVFESDAGAKFNHYVSGNGSEIDPSNENLGYVFDFHNGGILMTGNSATKELEISGSFSVKDFNIYNTNETEESLIVESKFSTNSRFFIPESGIVPYDIVTPAVFINNESYENLPFAFGGEDKTMVNFKTVVLAENLYQLDGILSLFGDTANLTIPKINFNNHPINEYGDLKKSPYNYISHAQEVNDGYLDIERVVTSKISENSRAEISPSLYVGFIDFEVSQPRFPRLC